MRIFKTGLIATPLALAVLMAVPVVAFAEEANFLDEALWNFVVAVFGTFAGLAGMLLNVAVSTFVIGFGDQFLNSGLGYAVNNLWIAVRDIFNITFIFGLVYLGFKMILNSDDSNTRGWLANLIIAALLVNFSLFITKFVVDFTNILATEIAVNGFPLNAEGNPQISEAFMDDWGITAIFGMNLSDIQGLKGGGIYGYIFGSAVLFLVMTFVFAAGAFMLLIRYAALALYMVLSPLMFLGWVFPQLRSITSKYWHGFLGRAFFAPVYILLVYFSAVVLQQFYAGNANKSDFGLFAQGGDQMMGKFDGTLPPFIISCIFLIASVVVANKLSADGASTAMKVGKNLRGRVQRVVGAGTAGGAAWALRKGVGGQIGNRVAESSRVQALARRRGLAGVAGRAIADSANYARTASFDVRNIGGAGKAMGVGAGKKGGYVADQKAKEKEEKERAKRYSTQEDIQLYEKAGEEVADFKRRYDEVIKNISDTMAQLANATNLEERVELREQLSELAQTQKYYEENPDNALSLTTFNDIRRGDTKEKRQEYYAANLERRGFLGLRGFLTDGQANTRAAEAIRREVNKSNTDKLLDAINDLEKDKDKDKDKDQEETT